MQSERITLTPKQANIYTWGWQREARYRFAPCGRRFGKSYLAREEMRRAARLAMQWNISTDNEIWYGAPTFRQAKRVFWSGLKRSIPRAWVANRPNESECSITLTSGHVIRIVGLDDPDNLRGSGLWFFVGDEWDDAKDEVWPEVIRPMLSTAGGHALFLGSPKGFAKLYTGFVDGQSGSSINTKSWTYTTIQGGNVPSEEIEDARRSLDGRTFRQEYEASFETFSGLVYYAFSRAHAVRACPYNPALPLHIGMDFNVNPMSATVWQELGSEIHQVGEVVIPTANTHDMVDEIRRRYGKPDIGHITIYPDPAGAQRRTSAQGKTDISILRETGFRVIALSSHPLVRDRVNAVNSKFQTADGVRHAFVDPSCVKSIECYERQVYKEGTSEPDKSMGFDHLCFSGDVLVDTIEGPVAFDSLPASGLVRTWNGEYVPYILGGMVHKQAGLVELSFDDGSAIRCTPDHKIFTQRGWVCAIDSIGDFAYNWLSFLEETKCISLPMGQNAKSFEALNTISAGNIFRQAVKGFIGLFGKRSTGRLAGASIFTIPMRTARIMNQRTWSVLGTVTISAFICARRIGGLPFGNMLLKPVNLLRSGTVASLAWNGIANIMQKWEMPSTGRLLASAPFALQNSRARLTASHLCFVPRHVRPRRAGEAVLMTSRSHAYNAEHCSPAGNTSNGNIAATHAQVSAGGKYVVSARLLESAPVYCLTVPGHGCFALADGTIVKNCDSTGYYIFTRFGGVDKLTVQELRI